MYLYHRLASIDNERSNLIMERTIRKLIESSAQQDSRRRVSTRLATYTQSKYAASDSESGKNAELGDESVQADFSPPRNPQAAFEGAHGVFLDHPMCGKKAPTSRAGASRGRTCSQGCGVNTCLVHAA